MEVHHHGHHEGKKTWKSYIWEFLMLFFAVFCGFLAEWRLELMIEHHREEEYIQSIVEDLNADVVQTDKLVGAMDTRIVKIDSLLLVLASDDVKQNSDKAYQLWMGTIGFPDFVQNDRTIQQLKSSGALRIIRKNTVSDKIMEYDQAVRLMGVTQNNMNAVASNGTLFHQMFNFVALNQPHNLAIPLTENGQKQLNEAYANRFFWKFNLQGFRKRLLALNSKAKEVVGVIKREYRLK